MNQAETKKECDAVAAATADGGAYDCLVKMDLLEELLDEALEVRLRNGSRLIRHTDGKWYGLERQIPTKMRYDFIGDAFERLRSKT